MSTRLLLEGSDIESLLSRVREEHGPRARIVAADKVRSGGIAGFFARERFEVQVELDEPESPSGVVEPSRCTTGDGPASLLELAAAVDEIERASGPMGPMPSGLPTVSTDSADFTELLSRLVADSAGAPNPPSSVMPFHPAVVAPAPAPGPAGSAAPAPGPAGSAAPPRSCEKVWHGLGLPEPLCSAAPRNPRDVAGLIDVFAALPTVPRLHRTAGDVVVVMGEGLAGLEVARLLARRLRIDPDDVLLAAPGALGATVNAGRRIGGPVQARRRAGSLHRASTASVIAVDAPMDDDGPEWAREVADALDAAAVWAVVDATRKTADLADHLDHLGRVDALAVHHAARTRDPASVLHLERPVALLDGAPATARAWALLLHEKATSR